MQCCVRVRIGTTIDHTVVLCGIARQAQRLNVVDGVCAAATKGNHMIGSQRSVFATAYAAVVVLRAERDPFFPGETLCQSILLSTHLIVFDDLATHVSFPCLGWGT